MSAPSKQHLLNLRLERAETRFFRGMAFAEPCAHPTIRRDYYRELQEITYEMMDLLKEVTA